MVTQKVFETHNVIRGDAVASEGPGETSVHFPHQRRHPDINIVNASPKQVDTAVSAAYTAYRNLRHAGSVRDKVWLLQQISRCLRDHADELSYLETLDTGKLRQESEHQIQFASRMYEFYAGLADKLFGSTMPLDAKNIFNYTLREPLGVVAIVTAWNSPLQLLANKLAPALAAGNAVVIKPSEQASLSTVRFVSLLREYDIPVGLINVVTGDHRTGADLVRHSLVSHTSFTGGPRGGRSVGQLALEKLNSVTLELGGKSPNIVFDDADLDSAVTGSLVAGFSAAGQTCVAGSRLLVSSNIKDEFLARLSERADAIAVGDPFDSETQMGPIGTKAQYEQIIAAMNDPELPLGATMTRRPLVSELHDRTGGNYLNPQVMDISGLETPLRHTEIFGPILVAEEFSSEDEAVSKANDSPFGLAAGIWTKDLARTHRLAGQLECGTVWVNTYRQASVQAPFGGYKESGLGRERGIEAIDSYLQTKNVMINLDSEVNNPYGL